MDFKPGTHKGHRVGPGRPPVGLWSGIEGLSVSLGTGLTSSQEDAGA